MAKQTAISLKPGNVIEHNGKIWVILKTHSVHPGKGNSVTQMEIRDLYTGTKANERFRTQENVERVRLDEKEFLYLFHDGGKVTLMDNESYEQIEVEEDKIGEDKIPFLQDGMILTVLSHEGRVISVSLPSKVICEIAEADAVVKGQTASSSYKPAVLDNGVNILVPPHITAGTKVVVKTEDGSYVEKAK